MARQFSGGELKVSGDAVVIDAHVHLYPPEINRDPAGWAAEHGEKHWAILATRVRGGARPPPPSINQPIPAGVGGARPPGALGIVRVPVPNAVGPSAPGGRAPPTVQSFPSLRELLVALDGAGVDRAVLQGWYWERAESCARQNAFYADCVRQHPDRLAAAVTVQPLAGAKHVQAEFARARDAGFQGVGELSPHSQGYAIDDPNFELVLRAAGEWRWPVNLHVTAPDARPYPGMVATPLADFEVLAGRFPQTDFILAHFGGAARVISNSKTELVARVVPNALADPGAGSEPLAQQARWGQRAPPNTYYDSAAGPLLYGQEIWQRFPPGRVLFGSDFPLNLYPALDAAPNLRRFVDAVRSKSGLPPAELSAVLGGTANRWFSVRATI